MTDSSISELFQQAGGVFITPVDQLRQKLANIKALVFDWDGVFNLGHKGKELPSSFSEPDSMGINLLRFAYWQMTGQQPITAIITGASNPTAHHFADRERFHFIYSGIKHKTEALDDLLLQAKISEENVLFVFDDVIDLSVAKRVGVSYMVNRSASPLLRDFVVENCYADYLTANNGGGYAVREVCELTVGLLGSYADVLNNRIAYSDAYTSYFDQRNQIISQYQK